MHIIVNPHASNIKKAMDFLDKERIAYTITQNHEELLDVLKEKDEIIICGGDGTVHMLLNTIRDRPITWGILPCGRANDFADHLGMSRDPATAYKQLKGRTTAIDVISVNGQRFATGGGLGLPSGVAMKVTKLKRSYPKIMKRFGDVVYLLVVISQLIGSYQSVKIKGKEHLFYMIMNQPFVGKRFRLAPEANNTDGYLNTSIATKPSKLAHFPLLMQILKGSHVTHRNVQMGTHKELVITLDEPAPFMADGEFLEESTQYKIKLLPQATTVFTPQ